MILAPISAGHPQNFKTEIFPTNHKKGIFSLTLSTPAVNQLWNAVKYIFVCRSCVWMLSCMSENRTNTYWNECRVQLTLSWRLKHDHWHLNISKFIKVLVKVHQHIRRGHLQVPAVSFNLSLVGKCCESLINLYDVDHRGPLLNIYANKAGLPSY